MFSRIQSGGIRPASGATSLSKNTATEHAKVCGQNYDQIQFSSHLDETEKRIKDLVGQISQQIRTRPTLHEMDTLKTQFQTGALQPDCHEIAARMLLLREDESV